MTTHFLKSPPGADPIVVEGHFKATPERVFRAWTTEEDLLQWLGTHDLEAAQIDARVGGSWKFTFRKGDGGHDILHGQYLAVDAPRQLTFSWQHYSLTEAGPGEESPVSEVSVSFEAVDGGTFVRLTHTLVGSDGARFNIGGGWETSFGRMRKHLMDQGAPIPFENA